MTKRDNVTLSNEELQIEADFENGEYVPIENIEETKNVFKQMVKKKRNRKKISIRVNE